MLLRIPRIALLATLTTQASLGQTVWRVDADAAGTNNGSIWGDAFLNAWSAGC